MQRFRKVGQIAPVPSLQIKRSKIGLGFEKLDRDVFDPEKAYAHVAASGVKWIRIQSGWARTEKKRGVYDFAWLDRIVDTLVANGHWPWICLCYGNGLYDEAGAKVFGAVGCPPIHTDEQKTAWHRYVSTLVARYKGKVEHFEVWNEPDGEWCWKHGVNGREYGEFVIATAAAIHEGNPDAKVIAGSMCGDELPWLCKVAETGAFSHAWGFTYHCYTPDETNNPIRVRNLRALLKRYNPDIKIIQGESGSQSRSDGCGALRGFNWTEERQAKQLLRHTVSDLLCDVEFMSFFSCMDMIEALNGKVGDKASYLDYGYFGVLSAQFDENGRATGEYKPKKAYHALQMLAAIFREEPAVSDLAVKFVPEVSQLIGWEPQVTFHDVMYGAFERPNGARAFVYWEPANLMTETVDSTTSIQIAGAKGKPRLVDPMTGDIYEIPDEMIGSSIDCCQNIHFLPLRDYPLFLFWGDFA